MKVALSLIVTAVSASNTDTATPIGDRIGKILDTIAQCEAKVMHEGEQAQKAYTEYAEWCEDRATNLKFEVNTAKGQAEELQANIAKETSTQLALTSKIDDVGSDIAEDEKELAASTKIRNQESTDFQAEEKELTEVSDSLTRAIATLEREMQAGGASMMQLKSANSLTDALKAMVQASVMNTADAQKLTAFMQSSNDNDDDDSELGAPAAAAYESHSGGIVDVLNGLRDKASEQLDNIRSAETAAKSAYEQSKQSLKDAMKYANEDLSEAKKGLATSQEAQAVAQGDLDVTQKDLSEDSGTLASVHQACMARAQDFETQTKSRSEEMKGLAMAKDAINQIVLRGNLAFLQISAAEEPAKQVVHHLRDLARKHKDENLAQIASRMASTVALSSGSDVFAKIKANIEDSIAQLEAEQAADATHTEYCNKELAEAKEKVANKEAKIQKHTTKIDLKSSTSSRVKEEVAVLQKELALMVKEKLEMDNMRQKEKADYEFNKAETSQSLTEIKFALKVLRDFYDAYQKKHTGFSSQDGTADGIIAMLETVESEFSKSLFEMTAVEEAAVAEYTQEEKTFATDKVVKEKAIKYKTREYTALDKYASEETTDREGTQSQLDASNEALAQLEAMCAHPPKTYEERQAAREAEIADLKDSLASLDEQTSSEAPAEAPAESPAVDEQTSLVQSSAKHFRGGVRTRTA